MPLDPGRNKGGEQTFLLCRTDDPCCSDLGAKSLVPRWSADFPFLCAAERVSVQRLDKAFLTILAFSDPPEVEGRQCRGS